MQSHDPILNIAQRVLVETKNGTGLVSISFPVQLWGLWDWNTAAHAPLRLKEKCLLLKSATTNDDGQVLVVHESGLVRLRQEGKWESVNFHQQQVRDIEFVRYGKNGDLWIGTQRGLFLYKHSSPRWTYLHHESPDPRNIINEIIVTKDQVLWLATSNGLEIHKADGTVKFIDRIRGKELYIVTGLVEAKDGNVWISSGANFDGAYRWDGKEWKQFCVGTPLQGNKIHKIRLDSRGRLWFLAIWPIATIPESLATL